eukprot:TRINITY_DN10877_c0_g2_i1.p1 TRINITY_DN10877_c0_g2~~TRINITY_DN10877_c0_g2_i1.p1  ORF type:complete len:344 (-),score=75.27 TRINITY_DN10877_c0_g2_i1:4-1035(-)
MYALGRNQCGQLGTDTRRDPISRPTKVKTLVGEITSVSCGDYHSMALTRDGALYCWGDNEFGQLGIGKPVIQSLLTPTLVPFDGRKIIQIACGGNFSMALSEEGVLYSWGLSFCEAPIQDTPQRVAGVDGIIEISCAYSHVLALSKEGDLYCWGNNENGELGTGNMENQPRPVKITAISNIKKFCCGGFHSMALLGDGSLYCWGANDYGQLGIGNRTTQIVPTVVKGVPGKILEMMCGLHHSMVITDSYELYGWGNSIYGQLGQDKEASVLLPIKIQLLNQDAICFGRENIFLVQWPGSHRKLSDKVQKLLEEMVLIFKFYNIPKDISIYFSKMLLLHKYFNK